MELEAELNIVIDLVEEGLYQRTKRLQKYPERQFKLLSLPVFNEKN